MPDSEPLRSGLRNGGLDAAQRGSLLAIRRALRISLVLSAVAGLAALLLALFPDAFPGSARLLRDAFVPGVATIGLLAPFAAGAFVAALVAHLRLERLLASAESGER